MERYLFYDPDRIPPIVSEFAPLESEVLSNPPLMFFLCCRQRG
jgi:hypothetical protein